MALEWAHITACLIGSMLILSWNVAGWPPTIHFIRQHYKSLPNYFNLHGADVVAIQETKVTADKLTQDPTAVGAADNDADGMAMWESYWCCNRRDQGRGFNGVATYARKGLTLAADACPFGDAELDAEGRCLLTVYETFCMFNVYVPNSGEGQRIGLKMRFLDALRAKMQEVRPPWPHSAQEHFSALFLPIK